MWFAFWSCTPPLLTGEVSSSTFDDNLSRAKSTQFDIDWLECWLVGKASLQMRDCSSCTVDWLDMHCWQMRLNLPTILFSACCGWGDHGFHFAHTNARSRLFDTPVCPTTALHTMPNPTQPNSPLEWMHLILVKLALSAPLFVQCLPFSSVFSSRGKLVVICQVKRVISCPSRDQNVVDIV